MRNWTNLQDRRDATLLFVAALNQDPELRTACKANPNTARETFKTVGDFDEIPSDVAFYVFEESGPERDKHCVILLPDPAKPAVDWLPIEILNCTHH